MHLLMGTPAGHDTTTAALATGCNEEFIVMATPEREYYTFREIFTRPEQETCSFVNAELVY